MVTHHVVKSKIFIYLDLGINASPAGPVYCKSGNFRVLNFSIFLFWDFHVFRICEFEFLFSASIIIIILAWFLNSRISPPREIREN